MDSNKDEALRCVCIAKEAIESGNKGRALKFIKIAQRLNHSLPVDELLAACEKLDSESPEALVEEKHVDENKNGARPTKSNDLGYNEEHVQLIRQIKRNKDYYVILGVEKTCSVEDIRKAYRKLSLKVHPDKNKAPGSEEAFKEVCKAFKCLSDDDSRRLYDQTGLVQDYRYNQQHNFRRRRRTTHDLFGDDFDPDEVFRSFFGQADMFRTAHIYRTRGTGNQPREDIRRGGSKFIIFLQIIPFLLIFLLAYLPFSEPDYSLYKNYSHQIAKTTEKHGVEFFVKSSAFDENFPLGSPARDKIEKNVVKDYKNMLWRYCHVELQKRQWSKNLPTPYCKKLNNLGLA